MSAEPDNLALQRLRDLRAEIGDLRAEMASDLIEVRREIAGVGKDLGDQVVGLRRALVEYRTSVIGHGVIIGDREARLRRVGQHLDLPPLDAH